MQFRILGPLEVVEQGEALPLGGGQQLALFAVLLLHANEVVSTDRLVDELWTEKPPATAGKIVRNYVSLLRKQLGDRLVTRAPGYLLRVEPGELDSERFETLVQEAREQQPADAAAKLRDALALWGGPPLTQFAYEPFAQHAIQRLEELRLGALEDRIDADLQLGQDRELVPELEQLVRDHPLRERPRSLLMLALYRAGRQAEALDVYADGRRVLVDELGLEPSPDLQELQRRILAHDPTLAGPKRTRLRARRKGGLLIAAGGLILLAAGLATAAVEFTDDSPAGLTHVEANSVGVIDPATNRIVGEVPVGDAPTRIALAGNALWVANSADRTVSRVDVNRRVLFRDTTVPGPPSGVAGDGSGAWVVYRRSQSTGNDSAGSAGAVLVDPSFGHDHVTRTVVLNRLWEFQDAIAVGANAVWVADPGFVTRLDAATGKIRKLFPIGYTHTDSVAVGEGAVWAVNGLGVVRIDPRTNSELTIPIAPSTLGGGPSPTAVAVGEGAVWVASRFVVSTGFSTSGKRGTVSRIDPKTNAVVETITVGREPFAIAAGEGAVWVTNRTDFTVSRIDPRTNTVTATIAIGNRPEGLAVGANAVWVSVS